MTSRIAATTLPTAIPAFTADACALSAPPLLAGVEDGAFIVDDVDIVVAAAVADCELVRADVGDVVDDVEAV